MPLIEDIVARHSDIIAWRHDIHAHPETAYEEIRTGDFVAETLASFGIAVHRGLGKTGVVGVLVGTRGGSGSIGLRADMDALNLRELNDCDHKSQHDGKMHACGHDGHTAMLLAAAQYLAQHRDFSGRVVFIFQPAEEGAAGAKRMIEEGLFEQFPVDEVYGMHNWPEYREGLFCVKSGGLMAATDRFDVTVQGAGGHAAMPHQAIDSIAIATHLVTALQQIASRQVDPMDQVVVSVTQIHAGDADNVLPDSCYLCLSLRSLNEDVRAQAVASIQRISEHVCAAYSASCTIDHRPGYPVTCNHAEQTAHAHAAAVATVGAENICTEFPSTMGSEDFAFMLQQVPGCYVFLGNTGDRVGPQGNPCMLHNPYYDFNDNILPIGASFYVHLIQKLLGA